MYALVVWERKPYQEKKDARTSLARLANQRQPAVTGAGSKRLAMKPTKGNPAAVESFADAPIPPQRDPNGPSPEDHPKTKRLLKIEEAGDFFTGKIKPKIRLSGLWLERAGFKPGHRVEVRSDRPGSLAIRFVGQSQVSPVDALLQ